MKHDLDRIAFRSDLKRAIIPTLVFTVFATGYLAFSFNVPVRHEDLGGTVIRSRPLDNYHQEAAISTYIELDSGRTVMVLLPRIAVVPKDGDHVIVVRYIKRFFGDTFGLK